MGGIVHETGKWERQDSFLLPVLHESYNEKDPWNGIDKYLSPEMEQKIILDGTKNDLRGDRRSNY